MTEYVPVFWDIETTGLNPMAEYWWSGGRNKVITVGVGTFDDWRSNEPEKNVTVFSGDSEYELIEDVRSGMHSILSEVEGWEEAVATPGQGDVDPEAFMVGYNSRSFDHTFWAARCGRLRQNPWPFGHQRKRLDLFRVATKRCAYEKSTKQDELAEAIGIEMAEDTIEGEDVPDLFEDGDMATIEQHCRADIEDMMDIFLHYREESMTEFYDHYNVDKEWSEMEMI